MTETKTVLYDPRRILRAERVAITPEEGERIIETLDRALRAKKPAKEDLREIRKLLVDRPEMCKAIFSLVDAVQTEIIKYTIGEQDVTKMAVEEYVLNIRDAMGYHDAPIMEKLLIENIVTAWLRVQACESQLAFRMTGQHSIAVLEFWERRLSMAQRRYLSACESLAKIRKMAIPALQLNIGDKQVNVAGNLQAGRRADE